jgi:O-antigen ligase
MTTSVSNDEINTVALKTDAVVTSATTPTPSVYRIRHTLASRYLILIVCIAIVMSTLAFGTVHYWAMALFNLGALTVLTLWVIDGWTLGQLRISRNPLQLPLCGALLLGLIQLLPLRPATTDTIIGMGVARSLSLDPHSTRLVIVQLFTLLVYFAAVLVFIDTPRRLRLIVRTIIIFGFFLAVFGLTQSVTSPTKVYWFRELAQSTAFGPFINRHHFAGYMELTLAFPLGLLLAGAVDREKRLLYLFVAMLMGIALITTASRGGVVSLVAEVLFLVVISGYRQKERARRSRRKPSKLNSGWARTGLAFGLLIVLFLGVSFFGGDLSLARLIDSVNTNDPTTGRSHFWSVTLNMIKAHPILGTGLGAFGVIYTRFDTRNGFFRLEQAHNDYLQVLSDGGIIGAVLAISFVVLLFLGALRGLESKDDFRRGVAMASLAGCVGVLVHSFFDFTLHTPSNALLFLVLAGLATLNGRVEQVSRGRRRSSRTTSEMRPSEQAELAHATTAVTAGADGNSSTRLIPSDNDR